MDLEDDACLQALYNQTGLICTLFNKKFIYCKTDILFLVSISEYPPENLLMNANDEDVTQTKFHPLLLTSGKEFLLCKDLKDGMTVRFDAIKSRQGFIAIAVWARGPKPKLLNYPSNDVSSFVLLQIFEASVILINFATQKLTFCHGELCGEAKVLFDYSLFNTFKRLSLHSLFINTAMSKSINGKICAFSNRFLAKPQYFCTAFIIDETLYETYEFEKGNVYTITSDASVLSQDCFSLHLDVNAELFKHDKQIRVKFFFKEKQFDLILLSRGLALKDLGSFDSLSVKINILEDKSIIVRPFYQIIMLFLPGICEAISLSESFTESDVFPSRGQNWVHNYPLKTISHKSFLDQELPGMIQEQVFEINDNSSRHRTCNQSDAISELSSEFDSHLCVNGSSAMARDSSSIGDHNISSYKDPDLKQIDTTSSKDSDSNVQSEQIGDFSNALASISLNKSFSSHELVSGISNPSHPHSSFDQFIALSDERLKLNAYQINQSFQLDRDKQDSHLKDSSNFELQKSTMETILPNKPLSFEQKVSGISNDSHRDTSFDELSQANKEEHRDQQADTSSIKDQQSIIQGQSNAWNYEFDKYSPNDFNDLHSPGEIISKNKNTKSQCQGLSNNSSKNKKKKRKKNKENSKNSQAKEELSPIMNDFQKLETYLEAGGSLPTSGVSISCYLFNWDGVIKREFGRIFLHYEFDFKKCKVPLSGAIPCVINGSPINYNSLHSELPVKFCYHPKLSSHKIVLMWTGDKPKSILLNSDRQMHIDIFGTINHISTGGIIQVKCSYPTKNLCVSCVGIKKILASGEVKKFDETYIGSHILVNLSTHNCQKGTLLSSLPILLDSSSLSALFPHLWSDLQINISQKFLEKRMMYEIHGKGDIVPSYCSHFGKIIWYNRDLAQFKGKYENKEFTIFLPTQLLLKFPMSSKKSSEDSVICLIAKKGKKSLSSVIGLSLKMKYVCRIYINCSLLPTGNDKYMIVDSQGFQTAFAFNEGAIAIIDGKISDIPSQDKKCNFLIIDLNGKNLIIFITDSLMLSMSVMEAISFHGNHTPISKDEFAKIEKLYVEKSLCEGLVINLSQNCLFLLMHTSQIFIVDSSHCFLFGISLNDVDLRCIFHEGQEVEYVYHSSQVIVFSEAFYSECPSKKYSLVSSWIRERNLSKEIVSALLNKVNYVPSSLAPVASSMEGKEIVELE